MTSRRQFLTTAAAASLANRAWGKATPSSYQYTEFEARLARRDFRGITKDVLPTPCMVVDLAMFQQNLNTMAATAKTNGINVRPHVKIHKSVDVAKDFSSPRRYKNFNSGRGTPGSLEGPGLLCRPSTAGRRHRGVGQRQVGRRACIKGTGLGNVNALVS
jgi:hypothetical protein